MHRPLQRAEIILVGRRGHRADRRARDDETERMDRIGRVGRQYDVARRGNRSGEAGEAFLRSHGDDDFRLGVEIDAEAASVIIGLCPAEARNTLGLRIAMRARLLRHFHQLVDDMSGGREIRVAHAEVDNVLASRARRCPHRIHFGDDIGRQSLDAVELFGHFDLHNLHKTHAADTPPPLRALAYIPRPFAVLRKSNDED